MVVRAMVTSMSGQLGADDGRSGSTSIVSVDRGVHISLIGSTAAVGVDEERHEARHVRGKSLVIAEEVAERVRRQLDVVGRATGDDGGAEAGHRARWTARKQSSSRVTRQFVVADTEATGRGPSTAGLKAGDAPLFTRTGADQVSPPCPPARNRDHRPPATD